MEKMIRIIGVLISSNKAGTFKAGIRKSLEFGYMQPKRAGQDNFTI